MTWNDWCYSSELVFFFCKESISLRHEGRPIPQERHQPGLAPSFYTCCHLHPLPICICPMQIRAGTPHWSRRGHFVLPEVLNPVESVDFPLVPFSGFFSPFLVCLLATVILDSFLYSNYLTLLLQFSVSAYFDAQLVWNFSLTSKYIINLNLWWLFSCVYLE